MDTISIITIICIPALAYISYKAGFHDGITHTVDYLTETGVLDLEKD